MANKGIVRITGNMTSLTIRLHLLLIISYIYCHNFEYNKFIWKYQQKVKKCKGKVQGVPQSQPAALSRRQEEEETVKSKQAQIEQTYEKH